MSFFDSALSAIGQTQGGGGFSGALQGLFAQTVAHSELAGKLDALLQEHSIPLSSAQLLGFLKDQGMVEHGEDGVTGTPSLGNIQEHLPQLLSGIAGSAGGLGGLLGGLGRG